MLTVKKILPIVSVTDTYFHTGGKLGIAVLDLSNKFVEAFTFYSLGKLYEETQG